MVPASQLVRAPWNTGIEVVDGLCDGVLKGAVTQVRGPPGTGKTVLCTALSVVAAAQGTVAYIDADCGFSPQRAVQLGADDDRLARILVGRPHELGEQAAMAQEAAELDDLCLLVVDSVVCHYRMLALRDREEANAQLVAHMASLKRLAVARELPVVVTNHVWRDRETGELQPVAGDILAYRSGCVVDLRRAGMGTPRRRLVVRKHPWIPEGRAVEVTIAQDGVHATGPGILDRLFGTAEEGDGKTAPLV